MFETEQKFSIISNLKLTCGDASKQDCENTRKAIYAYSLFAFFSLSSRFNLSRLWEFSLSHLTNYILALSFASSHSAQPAVQTEISPKLLDGLP